ncbi:putative proline-specific permease [Glarea lozoyensis 74030]|uniref:Putative proline-specific permease n=1 Tax=Glarea lozoyensis (strain ATCC 74030 / MF5533) TaxID=1104152 RepID=H0EEA1_GLAL7|nr:putative proline-specific permease [Glarea lozoyensis 74030]
MESEKAVHISEEKPTYDDKNVRSSTSDPEFGEGEAIETTKRGLKARHAQMIALGGTIGGPAFILVAYIILSILVLFVVTGITEVAAYLPVSGGTMSYYGHRNVSNSLGFAMGWLYFYSLGILVPYEITAAGLVIDYWNSPVNIGVWITIFIIVIVGLNTLPVQFYGETEFWFASLKVFMMIGLLVLSFILFWGGGPNQQSGGTGTFIAFWKVIVLSAFPFTFAPELLVVTGGEMKSPRRNLPIAAKRYFYRLVCSRGMFCKLRASVAIQSEIGHYLLLERPIVFFYIGSVLAIGIISPFNAAALTDGGVGAKSSAFVVGIQEAGISGLGSVINAIIITSAWSSGNSFLYMSSRSLYSLAVAGNAPKIFTKCTKGGVPYMAVAAASLFSPLAYLNCANSGSIVFAWFVNLTNTSGFISWICCCIVYIRFRKATVVQNLPREAIPYRSIVQPYGAWIAMVAFIILTLINGFDVFFPEKFNAIIANEVAEPVGPVTWKKKMQGWFT